MLKCFVTHAENSTPITPIVVTEFEQWYNKQDQRIKNWVQSDCYKADPGICSVIIDGQGKLERVLIGLESINDFWSFGNLPRLLPAGVYHLDANFAEDALERAALAWGLGSYQFTPYKKQPPITAQLLLPHKNNAHFLEQLTQSIYLVRDLINTPTDDLGPAELGEAAVVLAAEFDAHVEQIVGDDLLTAGYPTIYAVGRASVHAPRLIDLRWGNINHPKITLVGKGVCFDTGGLDLKPADGMLLMKKDMSGAAHALGLARLIMALQLPVRLRVLIPAVENAISGDAFHPGDIITTRKGITVEVTNTDAEGRLILCDALAEASNEKPKLIIDFASLTGAAHVALGPELPALYTPQDELAAGLLTASAQVRDPIWRMPLYQPYRKYLESPIADMMNSSFTRFAGSITAALFLQQFVPAEVPWAHFDLMAWNPEPKPGRPFGGEALAFRTVFHYLQNNFI